MFRVPCFAIYFCDLVAFAWLFVKPGTQERGMEFRECGERGECSLGLLGILLFYYSRECWRRFRGMFEKIPGNVQENSGECFTRFRGMFEKIPGDLNLDLFCEVLLIFYQILQLNCEKQRSIFCATNYYI